MKTNNYNTLHVILLLLLALFSVAGVAANQVQGVRIWPSPDNTRVVFDMAAAPEHKSFSLDNPDRLVIDLRNIKGGTTLPAVTGESPVIKAIRSPKTGAYTFKENIVHKDLVKEFLAAK